MGEMNIKVHPPPAYWENSYNNIIQRIWHNQRYKVIQKVLSKLPDGARILDIGCGSGFSMEKSIPKGKDFQIYGIDVTEDLINYAKKKRPHFNFKVAYGEKLPYENNAFDAVLYSDVIEHLKDPVESLNEAHRVLKKDGFVVITVVKEYHPMFRIIWWLWTKFKGKVWHGTHLSIYDEKSLKRQLEEAGFKVTKMSHLHLGMSLVAVAYRD
jgi:ubiquinone/menaquinone biosynthesis C-methylase UbiE